MRAWEHTLTVDASVDARENLVGIGIVVQARSAGGGRGPVIERVAELHRGIARGSAEELAILRALQVAKARGFSRVKVRCDDNPMRSVLHDAHRRNRMPAGSELRRSILELASTFEYVHFAWVPRRKNQRARALAREARRLAVGSEGQA